MRAGSVNLRNYHTPNPRWTKPKSSTPLLRGRKVKKLGYAPKNRWDGMTRGQKALVKATIGTGLLGTVGGLLGGLLGKKKKQKGSGRTRKRKTSRRRR